ncbi:MAG: hypothetical protein IT292_11300 [Deltaproteobacteria bacterium]|nr:hypothetical protein [Deltaproteobacteria bacterium]
MSNSCLRVNSNVRIYLGLLLLGIIFTICPRTAGALEKQSFIICTQNAHMLGEIKNKKYPGKKKRLDQNKALAQRIADGNCDIVALQEIYGKTDNAAKQSIKRFVTELKKAIGKEFEYALARTNDKFIRNAFVYQPAKVHVERIDEYYRRLVPTLAKHAPTRRFNRGPLGLLASVKISPDHPARKFYFLTFHLKSRVGGWKDLSKTEFEIDRLEAADALRTIVSEQQTQLGSDIPLVVLGDRNADSGAASVEVMSGKLRLEDFQRSCQIKRDLKAQCDVRRDSDLILTGLFDKERRRRGLEGDAEVYSYKYRKDNYLYDEIYVSAGQVESYFLREGKPMVEMIGTRGEGSDHLLMKAGAAW